MSLASEVFKNIESNVSKVIVGKSEVIRAVIASWMAGGHVLLEDVPGTGKTMLARALAKSTALDFKRVQFTPDLLPSDILGTSVYVQGRNEFSFYRGPIFTTFFLGDEINRATPRTQSALLECMAEGQITVEGQTHILPPHFFVIATQNPIEQHGTFPLPEAQMDRFMMRLSLGYPSPEDEIRLVKNQQTTHPIQSLTAVETEERILAARKAVQDIAVSDQVLAYASKVIQKTRTSKDLRMGASPRGMIALIRAAQAMAIFDGLDFVKPTHIFHLAPVILSHRLVVTPQARMSGRTAPEVMAALLKELSVPTS